MSCYAFRRSESRCPLALQWGQKLPGSPHYFQMAKLHRGATIILDSPTFLLSKGKCWWEENILKCNIIWNLCKTSYLYFSMKQWSNNRQIFIKIPKYHWISVIISYCSYLPRLALLGRGTDASSGHGPKPYGHAQGPSVMDKPSIQETLQTQYPTELCNYSMFFFHIL